jgi:hypothetical protein
MLADVLITLSAQDAALRLLVRGLGVFTTVLQVLVAELERTGLLLQASGACSVAALPEAC